VWKGKRKRKKNKKFDHRRLYKGISNSAPWKAFGNIPMEIMNRSTKVNNN
jgi:hypothetical protein